MLQFALFVDDTQSGDGWLDAYRRGMKGRATKNYIELQPNEDFDAGKLDEEDGFLFFPYCIEVIPTTEVTESHQIALAQAMKDLISSAGARVVVAANFENEIT